ncbi:MAG: hypothetical protein GEU73_00970 [Chloroflexi bacterium]|nr:hypothetical protein [Chloroflexota bacterium]
MTARPSWLPPLLWVLLALFVFRVGAQLLVANGQASWLPPMAAWHSGVVPYHLLVPGQIVLTGVIVKVCVDLTRGRGLFAGPKPFLGTTLVGFGVAYLLLNSARYVLYVAPSPVEHLVHLPVFFHYVLAAFVLSVGAYHRAWLTAARS